MTERELGPSPPTQSRCRHPCTKFPRNDTSTAAILPRLGRRLLTLAPTRRASAPREEFCARTEAGVSRFRAAAALRPLAGALDWLQAGEPALSRSRGRCLKGRPSVRLPSRSPPPPPPRLPPPPPIPGASPPSRLGRPPPPRAAVETALRRRRDPHGSAFRAKATRFRSGRQLQQWQLPEAPHSCPCEENDFYDHRFRAEAELRLGVYEQGRGAEEETESGARSHDPGIMT
ncbi:glucose-induced degradation protein 8 homolog isoform X1 [Neofelis nebulosa]|uniref:glucose-induced degradation protein 8 homolog isoform X1 n=1 Tax=Neofelis nebulosa TaxID=61452 RepID=UPI00272D285B|nr:glucose-induced degradation protein 8 homolog isoform X1 [Neofelis nebulosa]